MDNGGPEPVKYKIRVSKKSIHEQVKNGKTDKGGKFIRLRSIDFGTFRREMEREEEIEMTLKSKQSIAYRGIRRNAKTPYIHIFAYCGHCRYGNIKHVNYNIVLKRDEYKREGDYVRVDVTRFGEHKHIKASKAAESTREERTVSIRAPRKEIKEEELSQASDDVSSQHDETPALSEGDESNIVINKIHDLDKLMEPLMSVCLTADNIVKGKQLNGLCQQLELYPYFNMILFAEQQLDCINAVDVQHRVLQIHASHSLFQLGPKYDQYDRSTKTNRVFNYRCVLNDQSRLDMGRVKVAELLASSDTVQTQNKFFILLKNTFESLHGPETFKFRLMVVDWSWATIEAMLDGVNKLKVVDYAKLCYDLADNKIRIDGPSSVSWLVTCADQTIKYFAQSLNEIGKQIGLTKAQHRNAMFCFGLLLTSTDLTQMSNYYRLFCFVFLSPTCTESVKSAQQSLRREFIARADFTEQFIDTGHSDSVDALRVQSPFGRHFSSIRHKVEHDLPANSSATAQPNQFFCSSVIDLLDSHFMPYSFIWAGFVFQGMPADARWSNGVINNKQSGGQRSVKPHKYVQDELMDLPDSCENFMNDLLI